MIKFASFVYLMFRNQCFGTECISFVSFCKITLGVITAIWAINQYFPSSMIFRERILIALHVSKLVIILSLVFSQLLIPISSALTRKKINKKVFRLPFVRLSSPFVRGKVGIDFFSSFRIPRVSSIVCVEMEFFAFVFVFFCLPSWAELRAVLSSMRFIAADATAQPSFRILFSFSMWKYLRGTSTPSKSATKRIHFQSNVCLFVVWMWFHKCVCSIIIIWSIGCVLHSFEMNFH